MSRSAAAPAAHPHPSRQTDLPEAEEVDDPVAEVAEGRVELPDEVQREPVVGEDEQEEDAVDKEVQEVGDQLEVEDVGALGLPPPLEAEIDHGHDVLEEELDDGGGLFGTMTRV